ncbi:hypothetical protein B5M09_001380 [Aphanomyces astaci]|uniref:Uncharacterized protein n=1 Tax=Aphanomyces astaci TaxID=112090 RepID=A0A3R8DE94_APHAT|nr:hypothetical protein B5M09_001380 [Aphanomyces astaci]
MVSAVTAYLCLIITLLAVATYAFYVTYLSPRFGTPQKLYVLLIALFYQLISIAAELTAIGGLMVLLAPDVSKAWAIIIVSVITCSYTLFGTRSRGIKASIATDAIKGGFVLLLVVIICIAAFSYTALPVDAFATTGVAAFTTTGFEAVFTLTIAIVSSNLFLTGFWLRTFAAKNNADLRKACAYAALAATPFIVLLGVVGFMGFIMHPEAPVFDGGFFFYILLDMPEAWSVLVLIVVAALVSSTADTVQTGMSAEILSHFQSRLSLTTARLISVVINIPAIFIALTDTSVLKLFLIADLLCAATVGPIFLGIWKRTHPWAVLAGCVSGLVTVLFVRLLYTVSGSHNAMVQIFVSGWTREGNFVDGFKEFVLEEGLFTTHSMVLFILTLVIPIVVTVGLTFALPPAPKRRTPQNDHADLLVDAPVNHTSDHHFEATKSPAVV